MHVDNEVETELCHHFFLRFGHAADSLAHLAREFRTMYVERLRIREVIAMRPDCHQDERGFFSETYSRRALAEAGIDTEFVQDNHSLSVPRGTLRGLHFQAPPAAQAKLVRVARGSILDVAVDLRFGSPSFGQHVRHELSARNRDQLYVPEGFAHVSAPWNRTPR